MKLFKQLTLTCLISVVMMSFFQCASTQKIEKIVPLTIGDVYYQHGVSGAQEGGSGYNIFIFISENSKNIMLDSVYFKGKQAKLELRNNTVFIGRFKSGVNQKQDFIMSNEPYAEYGNKVPKLPQKTPFILEDDECVVSYIKGDQVKYFKIENILKRASKDYQ